LDSVYTTQRTKAMTMHSTSTSLDLFIGQNKLIALLQIGGVFHQSRFVYTNLHVGIYFQQYVRFFHLGNGTVNAAGSNDFISFL